MLLRFSWLLGTGLWLSCCVLAEPGPAAGSAPAAELFGPRLKELLTLLQQRRLVAPLDPAVERAVGEALLRHVGCGARYADAAGAQASPSPSRAVRLRNRYLYCWFPSVVPGGAVELEKAIPAPASGTAIEGLVVDLRGVAQGTPEGVNRLAAVLTASDRPLVLLLNQETAGPAEVLAVLLRHRAGVSWVGQKTRGCFAFSEPAVLTTGETVLLPRPLGEFAGVQMPAAALVPDMAIESGAAGEDPAGLTAERFEAFPERDLALRTAVDLLTAIQALKPKEPVAK
jgi:hypothetical protein